MSYISSIGAPACFTPPPPPGNQGYLRLRHPHTIDRLPHVCSSPSVRECPRKTTGRQSSLSLQASRLRYGARGWAEHHRCPVTSQLRCWQRKHMIVAGERSVFSISCWTVPPQSPPLELSTTGGNKARQQAKHSAIISSPTISGNT